MRRAARTAARLGLALAVLVPVAVQAAPARALARCGSWPGEAITQEWVACRQETAVRVFRARPGIRIKPIPRPSPRLSGAPAGAVATGPYATFGSGMGPGCYVAITAPLAARIRSAFAAVGEDSEEAVRIADRESGCNPTADNDHSTAAGVFQFVAATWASWSSRCGYGGASAYDADANVAVAACAVHQGGWGPWHL